MNVLNLVILVGRLTSDPELQKTSSDVSFTRFSLAVQRNYIPKNGGGVRETDFFSIVAWRHTAEYICKYLKKGNLMVVQGSIRTGSYEKDGTKRTTFDIIASNVISSFSATHSPNSLTSHQENSLSDEEQFIF